MRSRVCRRVFQGTSVAALFFFPRPPHARLSALLFLCVVCFSPGPSLSSMCCADRGGREIERQTAPACSLLCVCGRAYHTKKSSIAVMRASERGYLPRREKKGAVEKKNGANTRVCASDPRTNTVAPLLSEHLTCVSTASARACRPLLLELLLSLMRALSHTGTCSDIAVEVTESSVATRHRQADSQKKTSIRFYYFADYGPVRELAHRPLLRTCRMQVFPLTLIAGDHCSSPTASPSTSPRCVVFLQVDRCSGATAIETYVKWS